MRTQGDELVCACCLLPADGVRRNALADWLRENDDAELADAVVTPTGVHLIAGVRPLGDFLNALPSVRLLYVAFVQQKQQNAKRNSEARYREFLLGRLPANTTDFVRPVWTTEPLSAWHTISPEHLVGPRVTDDTAE